MKKIFLASLLFLFVNSFSGQNDALKTLRFSGYKLKHPATWKIKRINDYLLLNRYENRVSYNRDVQIKVYPNHLKSLTKREDIKKILVDHAKILYPHEVSKNYSIVSPDSDSKFMCKIEYELSLDSIENRYKKIEFIRMENYSLKFYSYMAKIELFDQYYDEAIQIIYSIEKN